MSAVVDQTAESKSASQDDQIGDSLYPSKKMMMEGENTGTEMEKEKEKEKEKGKEEKTETVYYTGKRCENCKKMSTKKFEAMSDDDDYGVGYSEDEGLRLRVINYKRSVYQSGGFYVDCLPDGFYGGIRNRAHYDYLGFDDAAEESARHCIATYNKNKPNPLEFKRIEHLTAKQGNYTIYYLTFHALDPEKPGDDKTETYQAVVRYSFFDGAALDTLVFRKESTGEDLLDPDPEYGEWTRTARYYEGLSSDSDATSFETPHDRRV
ncbi:hypothetical protein LINGRAHAP2_LOCUS12044 [Linum grandiflorum]